jgi:hypothetical protein
MCDFVYVNPCDVRKNHLFFHTLLPLPFDLFIKYADRIIFFGSITNPIPDAEGVMLVVVPTDIPSPATGSEKYGSSSSEDSCIGWADRGMYSPFVPVPWPRDDPTDEADGSRRADETERDWLTANDGVRGMPTLAIWAVRLFVVSSGLPGMVADVGVALCEAVIEYPDWLLDPILGAKYPVVAIGEPEIDPVVYVVE